MGLHTEMFSDGVIPLIQNGIIDNNKKKIIHGYNVTSLSWVAENCMILLMTIQ